MTGLKILGVGKCAPENYATNEDYSKIVETNDEWITSRTGIKKRHLTSGEPTFYLAVKAAEQAIERAGIKPEQIGIIIATTITPDYYTPSLSCMVQRNIGAGCMAIDINCACSGFVYGLDMARRYLLTDDEIKYALVVSAEELSKITDYTDRSTCVLFGDGAGAVVVEKAENTTYASCLGADGKGACALMARNITTLNPFVKEKVEFEENMPAGNKHCLFQDGKEVYKFATRILPEAVLKCCEKAGTDVSQIKCIIPHQANYRIIETAAKHLGVTMDKFFLNLQEYGNTSSASVPLAFCEAVETGAVQRGDLICFVGFGAGLTFGGIVMEY